MSNLDPRLPIAKLCPKCGSSDFRYSHRQFKDGLLRLLLCSALRCNSCGNRYFRFSGAPLTVAAAVLLFVVLLIGVGRILWKYYGE